MPSADYRTLQWKLCKSNICIIFDWNWESQHPDNLLTSLTQQIIYSHSCNKKFDKPIEILVTNLSNTVREKLDKVNYQNWDCFHHSSLNLNTLLDNGMFINSTNYDIEIDLDENLCNRLYERSVKKKIIYLSADADQVLEDINHDDIYIIGAITDRNQMPGAALERAKSLGGVTCCRLPIKESLKTVKYVASPVLTVLNVFEILLRRSNHKDESWEDTLCAVLPKRKMQRKQQSRKEKLIEKSVSKQSEAASESESHSNSKSDSKDEDSQNLLDCSPCIIV